MTITPGPSLAECLHMLLAEEVSPSPQTSVSRKAYFKITRRNWLGIKRVRVCICPSVPTWDLLDIDGEDTGFCYVDKTGIAGKRTVYKDYGMIGGEYYPDLEDCGPFIVEELFLLSIQTIPFEKQHSIHRALQRLITV